ncbi:MAG: beta-lactamase family protein [Clostridiales bacterium]|nr:beta-lactamase family protein [Clostridiales bacterium]
MIKDYIDNVIIKKIGIPYFDVLVTRENDTIFRYYNNKDGNANGKEKLFMYSCSKVITAVATMMLIENGKLSLDDEVSKYLPCFNDVYLLVDGKKVKPNKAITVKHLLTMSAGFDYNFETEYIKNKFDKNPNSTTLDIINEIVKSPLNFEPGEKFRYSLCHDILGGVIEKVSGQKFSDFVEKNIFKPLGIKTLTFKHDLKDFEPLYYAENKKVVPFTFEEARWANHPSYESGGGGLKGTVEGYSKFLQGLLSGKLLKEETLDIMTQNCVSDFSVKNSYTCVQGKDYGYGLGVRVRKVETDWGLPIGEFGWDGAAGSYALVDRKNKITITIGMHVRNWPDVFINEHLKLVELIYKQFI